MHLLVVDIGNTDIKFGLFKDSRLLRHWRLAHDWRAASSPEAIGAALRASLQQQPDLVFEALAYSSVVPDLDPVLRQAVLADFPLSSHAIFAIRPEQSHLPVDFSGYASGQLGMDRLVTACGAYALHPHTPVMVFDFGTATTLDLIDAEGVYQGGAIAPGLALFSEILTEKTAQLPQVAVIGKAAEEIALGLNTVACMEAGLGLGYRGLVKELLQAGHIKLASPDCRVLATGGLADAVLRLCGLTDHFNGIESTLTLNGLAILYERHRDDPPII